MSQSTALGAAAQRLRELHQIGRPLLLVNVWDATTARAVLAAGSPAIATSSVAMASARGGSDDNRDREAAFAQLRQITAAVDVPVTADLERGYGDWVGTARAAWDAGIVGMNFEDSTSGGLVPVEDQVAAIEEIRAAVPALVLNARVDVLLLGGGDFDEAIARANAYLAAGADCVYPYTEDPGHVAPLVEGIAGPINVVLAERMPPVTELEQLGVARITWGGRLAALAYDEAVRQVTAKLAGG